MQKHDLPRKGYKLSGNQWYFVPKIIPTNCEKKMNLVIEKIFRRFEAEG